MGWIHVLLFLAWMQVQLRQSVAGPLWNGSGEDNIVTTGNDPLALSTPDPVMQSLSNGTAPTAQVQTPEADRMSMLSEKNISSNALVPMPEPVPPPAQSNHESSMALANSTASPEHAMSSNTSAEEQPLHKGSISFAPESQALQGLSHPLNVSSTFANSSTFAPGDWLQSEGQPPEHLNLTAAADVSSVLPSPSTPFDAEFRLAARPQGQSNASATNQPDAEPQTSNGTSTESSSSKATADVEAKSSSSSNSTGDAAAAANTTSNQPTTSPDKFSVYHWICGKLVPKEYCAMGLSLAIYIFMYVVTFTGA